METLLKYRTTYAERYYYSRNLVHLELIISIFPGESPPPPPRKLLAATTV
jgi:hypothetical protein